jgi:hypothetical protein
MKSPKAILLALEINLWLWAGLLIYVLAVRQIWDRYPLMVAIGLFVGAAAQFAFQRMLRRRQR